MKEELRSMRLEAHTKQLTKELKSARTALEQERKLRKVQSDTIKVCMMMNQFSSGRLSPFNAINTDCTSYYPQVLWKEIQALQVEQEIDREYHDQRERSHSHHGVYPDRRLEREKRRMTERKLGRLIGGAQTAMYDDSDSSRGTGCKS